MSKITSLIFYLLLFSCKEKQEILNDSENLIRIKTGDLFASNTRIELIDTTNNKILDFILSSMISCEIFKITRNRIIENPK